MSISIYSTEASVGNQWITKSCTIILIMLQYIAVLGMDSVLPSTKPYIPRVGKVSSCVNLEVMDKVCARSEIAFKMCLVTNSNL